MREYTGPKSEIDRVAFVPGDRLRLAAATDDAAYLWDLGGIEPPVEIGYASEHVGRPYKLHPSPDGRWLILGPADFINVKDLATLPSASVTYFGFGGFVVCGFAGAADGLRVVAVEVGSPELRALDVKLPVPAKKPTRAVRFELPESLRPHLHELTPDGFHHAASLSDDGSRFAVATGRLASVYVWDTATGKLLPEIRVRRQPNALALSLDGSRLAVDAGTTVYIFDVSSAEPVTKWKTNYSYVPQLAWSPDGRLIGRTDRSTTARLYDAATGRQVSALGTRRSRATAIAFAPDGLTYAIGHRDGTVRVWDVEA